MEDTAVFEFFVRRMPEHRNFMIFAGLEQLIEYLENLHFSQEELEWLERSGRVNVGVVNRLAEFRFSGDVHAMAEGTLFFPDEPVLRITAALPEAQLIESRLINILHYQTLIASKAARCRLVAPDKTLIDFGMRRAHGAEAALLAARANYIAGFDGTATVQAEQDFGIPVFGTMAHSYIQAHQSESQAFENFAHSHPDNVVLLIDTYDTRRGAEKVVRLAKSLEKEGIAIKAVRLDSGDLLDLATSVRDILDDGDCGDITIVAISMSTSLPSLSIAVVRSTRLALGPDWIYRRIHRLSTVFTNCRNTQVLLDASDRRERRPGRGANRYTVAGQTTVVSMAIW